MATVDRFHSPSTACHATLPFSTDRFLHLVGDQRHLAMQLLQAALHLVSCWILAQGVRCINVDLGLDTAGQQWMHPSCLFACLFNQAETPTCRGRLRNSASRVWSLRVNLSAMSQTRSTHCGPRISKNACFEQSICRCWYRHLWTTLGHTEYWTLCVYVCVYIIYIYIQKHQNLKTIKKVPYRTEKSQDRIPEDHRNGARMGLGHASEGGRCVGSLEVLKLLEAEYSKHVRTTNHFRWNVWIVHDSSCACRNIPPSEAFLAETFLILICWERAQQQKAPRLIPQEVLGV